MTENDAMRLEDLKDAWARLDQRVDLDFARMEAVTNALAEDRTRTLARRAMGPPAVDLILAGAGFVVCVTGFSYPGSAVYFACLVAVLAVLAALAISAACQMAMIGKLDPAAPVVATQRQLGRVRALRIFEWKWVLLLSPVLWTPFFVVGVELLLKMLSDGEAVDVFTAGYVVVSVVVGAAITGVLVWGCRRLAGRMRGSPFLRRFLDDLAGRRLTAARAFLARLDGFERE